MKAYYFMLLCCVALATTNCKKNNNSTKSKTELISSSSWKYESAGIDADNNGTGETPIPSGMLATCDTDNLLIFMANGTGTVDEGSTKCAAGDPQTTSFNWTFASNETEINISAVVFAGVSGGFKIITLTDTQLVLSKPLTIPGVPIPVTVVATFKH